MTKEQWIIYLYGIWPRGGLTELLVIMSVFWLAFLSFMYRTYRTDKTSSWKQTEDFSDYAWNKISTKTKILPIAITAVVLFFGSLIPDRNTFLALVATPSLVKSLEDEQGKLYKLNKLMDMGLDEAMKNLEED